MKKSVRVTFLTVLSVVLVCGMVMLSGCGSSSSSSSTPAPTATTYSGTLYMAATNDGAGHIAVFPVTIDPSNTTSPITVNANNVSKIQVLGAPTSSTALAFHDVRFGVNSDGTTNYNRIYYSGMMSLPTNTSVVPIGYVDLTNASALTNNGVNSDIAIDAGGMDTIAFALSQIAPVEFGSGTRIAYCASGMDKNYYFPMSMSFPAYIDAIPVTALEGGSKHITSSTTGFTRTYLGQIDDSMNLSLWTSVTGTVTTTNGTQIPLKDLGYPPLAFIHGASWTDPTTGNTKIYMNTNVMSGLTTTTNTAGFLRAYLVNASDLETESTTTPGMSTMTSSKVLSHATFTVAPSNSTTSADNYLQGTIAYRASFTPDGKYILQSGSDRMLILNAADLSLYADTANGSTSPSGASAGGTAITSGLGAGTYGGVEVHDVTSTPDGKYAILAMRYYVDSTHAQVGVKTSGVQLYDIANKKFIGNVATTCGLCHGGAASDSTSRLTCGIVENLK